jgi:uncharacterized protein YndB with AHSA1/START domain
MSETYSLTVERVIPGPIEDVFDAWLDPASMKQWMKPGPMTLSEATVDPVVGGKYALMFAARASSSCMKANIAKSRAPQAGLYVEKRVPVTRSSPSHLRGWPIAKRR